MCNTAADPFILRQSRSGPQSCSILMTLPFIAYVCTCVYVFVRYSLPLGASIHVGGKLNKLLAKVFFF